MKTILLIIIFISGCAQQITPFDDEIITDVATDKPFIEEDVISAPKPNEEFSAYVPTFMFHYVRNEVPSAPGYNNTFSPTSFERFLQYFKEQGIEPITFFDIQESLYSGNSLPAKSVILTFDDSHVDHYTEAFRLLEQYQMKGVFYVIADSIDDSDRMTSAQIQEIADAGHEIGSHSLSHHEMTSLSDERLVRELRDSKKELEDLTGKDVLSFCYPAGKYNQRVIDAVDDYYSFARSTESGDTITYQNRYNLPVKRILPTTGIASLNIWFNDENYVQ
jgi:peptidoglycan/xylan/chitin deacetylase (PgdA/CDA1 family)